jgi:GxxExxY protein
MCWAATGCVFGGRVALPLTFDGVYLGCAYRADIIVEDEVLLERKSIEQILPIHEAQLLTCLRFRPCRVGLLLNFHTVSLRDGIGGGCCRGARVGSCGCRGPVSA